MIMKKSLTFSFTAQNPALVVFLPHESNHVGQDQVLQCEAERFTDIEGLNTEWAESLTQVPVGNFWAKGAAELWSPARRRSCEDVVGKIQLVNPMTGYSLNYNVIKKRVWSSKCFIVSVL